MKERKQQIYKTAWYLAVFGILYLWFARVKPLVPYDGDDWLYLSYARKAVPLWGDWNPARVLPEVLMPLCGAVAAYVVMPLTGDYIGSITIVSAVVVSGFLTAYVYFFETLVAKKFSLPAFGVRLLGGLFLLSHFLVFRGEDRGNTHLFHCLDLTCYFYYLIPAALNCVLVMFLATGGCERLSGEKELGKKALFVALVYFAVFSNLPDSVILAVYAGVQVLLSFAKEIRGKIDWKKFLKENNIYWLILILWVISAVFELFGARAQDEMGYRLSFLQSLKETAYRLVMGIKGWNKAFFLFAAVTVASAGAGVVLTKKKGEGEKKFLAEAGEVLLCTVIMALAAVVLCAKVDITYISRAEYLFGVYFYGFLLVLMCLAYLLEKQPKILLVLPIVACILLSETHTAGGTYLDPNFLGVDAAICKAIDEDMIDQIVTASEAGQKEMVLHAPASDRSSNWPIAYYVGERIANTLFEHGVLDAPIQVTVEPDPEMNRKYGLGVPDAYE